MHCLFISEQGKTSQDNEIIGRNSIGSLKGICRGSAVRFHVKALLFKARRRTCYSRIRFESTTQGFVLGKEASLRTHLSTNAVFFIAKLCCGFGFPRREGVDITRNALQHA